MGLLTLTLASSVLGLTSALVGQWATQDACIHDSAGNFSGVYIVKLLRSWGAGGCLVKK